MSVNLSSLDYRSFMTLFLSLPTHPPPPPPPPLIFHCCSFELLSLDWRKETKLTAKQGNFVEVALLVNWPPSFYTCSIRLIWLLITSMEFRQWLFLLLSGYRHFEQTFSPLRIFIIGLRSEYLLIADSEVFDCISKSSSAISKLSVASWILYLVT